MFEAVLIMTWSTELAPSPLKEASPEVNSLRMGRIDSESSSDFFRDSTLSLISGEHQSLHQGESEQPQVSTVCLPAPSVMTVIWLRKKLHWRWKSPFTAPNPATMRRRALQIFLNFVLPWDIQSSRQLLQQDSSQSLRIEW